MGLQLYRRHSKACKAKGPEDSRTGKFEEGRRNWKKCSCQIFASGTLGGKFKRQCTENWEWDKAEELADGWQKAGSWPSGPKPPVSVPAPEAKSSEVATSQQSRKVVREAVEAYLSACKSREIKGSTQAKYKTLTNQLEAYCSEKGYTDIDQLQVTDMDEFYAGWKDAKKGKAKKLERLKGLVRFCLKRKWLTENIVEDLKEPRKASELNAKSPFEDEELERIYAACDKILTSELHSAGRQPAGHCRASKYPESAAVTPTICPPPRLLRRQRREPPSEEISLRSETKVATSILVHE